MEYDSLTPISIPYGPQSLLRNSFTALRSVSYGFPKDKEGKGITEAFASVDNVMLQALTYLGPNNW